MTSCSIVIPSRNRVERLRNTLSTLLNQRYDDFEIIVSDDGSDDATPDMVSSYDDDRVRLVRSEVGTGVSRARNRGIEASTGRWVALCDDDDLWHPDKLVDQLGLLEATGRRWSCSGAVHIRDDFSITHMSPPLDDAYITSEIGHGNPIPGGCSSVVLERTLLDEIGTFDPRFSMFADWDLWLRAFAASGPPAASNAFGVLYLVHADQMSTNLAALTGELKVLRREHREVRAQLQTPPIDSIDYWTMVTLRRAGRGPAALRHALTGAAGRGPVALRWSLNALTAKIGPEELPLPSDDAERDRQAAARAAVDDVRRIVERSGATG